MNHHAVESVLLSVFPAAFLAAVVCLGSIAALVPLALFYWVFIIVLNES